MACVEYNRHAVADLPMPLPHPPVVRKVSLMPSLEICTHHLPLKPVDEDFGTTWPLAQRRLERLRLYIENIESSQSA